MGNVINLATLVAACLPCCSCLAGDFLPSGRVAVGANYWASHAATEMWRKWDGGKLTLAGVAFDAEMRNLSDRKIAVVGKPGGASVNKERNQTVKDGESGRKTVSCRRFNPVPASMEGGSR